MNTKPSPEVSREVERRMQQVIRLVEASSLPTDDLTATAILIAAVALLKQMGHDAETITGIVRIGLAKAEALYRPESG